MSLGTNYKRISLKHDLITSFAILCSVKGELEESIKSVCKKLTKHNIIEIKNIIKDIKQQKNWI